MKIKGYLSQFIRKIFFFQNSCLVSHYIIWLPIVRTLTTIWGLGILGAIIGARAGDSLISHFLLYVLGYRPNPSFSTTSLYVVEAVFLLFTFGKGLALAPRAA